MKTLTDLGELLSEVTGLPKPRIKFEPPGKEKMQYPCIRYSLSRIDQDHADDTTYFSHKGYQIIFMSKDPESDVPDKILELPYCKLDRFYVVDGLNHWVFLLYY